MLVKMEATMEVLQRKEDAQWKQNFRKILVGIISD